MNLKLISTAFFFSLMLSGFSQTSPGPNYGNIIKEKLDRGLIAIHQGGGTVNISWRFSGKDPQSAGFDLYRTAKGGAAVKVNKNPIVNATYFTDKAVDTSVDQTYTLHFSGQKDPVVTYHLTTGRASVPYISIPLKPVPGDSEGLFSPNDASIGDLDGDGEMEIVLKRIGANYACSQAGLCPGGMIIEAYKLDGRLMWQMNLGPNIRQGAQYLQFLVGDFNGDGRAEVALKTSEGTRFGDGAVIGDTDGDGITDYVIRNSALRTFGKILSGPEFFSVVEGTTGRELARGPWIERGRSEDWGDDYGNRVDRQLGAVGYFDGRNLGIFWGRGYNGRSVMHAWNFLDGKLIPLWKIDTNNDPYKDYANQGNHNIRIGDVDGDGCDEVIYGACAIDHDGSPLYSTKLGHGDAMHLTDIDPSRPGLEVWQVHEYAPSPNGSELRDALTGEILVGFPSTSDVGRGMCSDIDPRYAGCEIWSSESGGLRSCKGVLISPVIPSVNMAAWWDGDLGRELLDGVRIDKWNGNGVTNLFDGKPLGIASNNGTKANPCLIADIFGDWREEVIWRSEQNDEIRIYMTPHATQYRMPTLLEDPIYRHSVAIQNVGYNQPTAMGFYLGTDRDDIMAARFAAMDSGQGKKTQLVKGSDWFLDGKQALVYWSKNSLIFNAGPTLASDADHAVLWTKREFSGDIKVEYDFTRLDALDRFVNIIYLQASGSGQSGFDRDISKWSDKRTVPAMSLYYNNMNTIHISYAAYENQADTKNPDYIRARRYMPDAGRGLEGTALDAEYLSPMLFEPLVTYHIVIIKRGDDIIMQVTDPLGGRERYFAFSTEAFPAIEKGRIGLRQMSGRNSYYSNFSVTELK